MLPKKKGEEVDQGNIKQISHIGQTYKLLVEISLHYSAL
jgi:hypothetical protein